MSIENIPSSQLAVNNVTDQMGNILTIPKYPQRIISLVPSQTELLFDLGLEHQMVGLTKFCIHPFNKVTSKTIIGGTKNFNFEAIARLKPDLIIGNKEENYAEGIARLQQLYPVWMSDIYNLSNTLEMIKGIGAITGTINEAEIVVTTISKCFAALPNFEKLTAAYFIWKNPFMVAANNTFINQMLAQAGFLNIFTHQHRYPIITPEDLALAKPEIILLSSEPFPFQEKHVAEFKEICPKAKVVVVDGELFSWPGSRLQYSPAYFTRLREQL